MKLLLDTHTFLWFVVDSPRLTAITKAVIEDGDNEIYVSMASLWEMAIKTSLQKLNLPTDFEQFVPHHISINHMALLPIDISHLYQVTKLPFHHRDPFDRLLIAQSIVEDMPIISRDVAFDQYSITRLWDSMPDAN